MSRRTVGFGLFLATTLALIACSGEASAQVRGRSDPRCIRPLSSSVLEGTDQSQQASVALACRDTATVERGQNAVIARFYAGRAYARAFNNDEAIPQLEVAVNAGRDFASLRQEVRAARLELAAAYRAAGRNEPARTILKDMSDSDPAVAYQKALLALVERGAAGQQSAFESLRVFAQDDRSLLIALGAVTQPSRDGRTPVAPTLVASPTIKADIQRGRSWLYRLGNILGRERLQAGDPRGAINYLRPVAEVVSRACPEPGPINCDTAVADTEVVGTLTSEAAPSADQMLNVYYRLGLASLKSAGLQDTLGLGGFSGDMGGIGALNCISSQTSPDAPGYFDAAARAFDTYIRRAGASAASAATAHWGLACTILASQGTQAYGPDPIRLNDAIAHLNQAPQDQGLTFVTKARAYILQGSLPLARESYTRALALLRADRCGSGVASGQGTAWQTPSRIYLEMARMQFAPSRIRDAGQTGAKASDLYDRVVGDVNVAAIDPLVASEHDLQCAIDYDPANMEARLTLASLYLRLGANKTLRNPLDPPPFRKAEKVLQYFRDRDGRNTEGAPEAYYLLSRRMTLARQFQIDPDKTVDWKGGLSSTGLSERDAVQFASRAYNLTQRAQYKSQACLSQILFGVIGEQSVCAANGDGDALTRSYFDEGLYWLRRGQKEGPGDKRLDSWARAIRAFNLGAERENGLLVQPIDPTVDAPIPLSELMLFGQRYTLKCILKKDPGGDTDRASQEVRRYFLFAGIPSACGGPAS